MKHQGAGAVCAICLPVAARAECTGGGCYDGLGLLIGVMLLAAVVVGGLLITLAVLLIRKRWQGAKIVAAILGLIAVLGLMFLG